MTLTAVTVGRERMPAYDERTCWRCGIEWRDTLGEWIRSAPCRDCRDVLREEGSDLAEYRPVGWQPRTRAGQAFCKRGHDMNDAYIINTGSGRQKRRCRTCHLEAGRNRRAA